jgi:hypothetical protein
VGGTLTPSDFATLADLIAGERLSVEWDGEPFDPSHRTDGEPLRLYAHEVAGGVFEALESWCVANAVPFVRWCGGYGAEWSPERVVYTGVDKPHSYDADENDRILVDRHAVERLGSIAALLAHFEAAAFAAPPLAVTEQGGSSAAV